MALVWDFYREIGEVDSTGGIVHYYDEQAQTIYLKDGMATKAAKVDKGHWKDAALSSAAKIGDWGDTLLAFDHPHNGILHGVASDGDKLYYLRYVYAMELSDVYQTGEWVEQADNQTKQLSVNVQNLTPEIFVDSSSLFEPGMKLTLAFTVGDSDLIPIGVVYLDEINYDAYADTVPLSGRNAIGFFLASQTFDDCTAYSGTKASVIEKILTDAGITDFVVQQVLTQTTWNFEFNKVILTGLNEALSSSDWRLVEDADGRVIVGNDAFIATYVANSRYVFDGGAEVFKRRTSKNADAAYTRVCVRDDENEKKVFRSVPHWAHWNLGAHKTRYYNAFPGMSIDSMGKMADSLATNLQYVGIGEAFESPIRPQLLPGDIAEVYYEGDTESISLGLITEVKHRFGKDGFFTSFNLDSGGVATDAEGYTIVSHIAMLDGYNRQQKILDIMSITAQKTAAAVYAGGGQMVVASIPAEAASVAPASIMRIL